MRASSSMSGRTVATFTPCPVPRFWNPCASCPTPSLTAFDPRSMLSRDGLIAHIPVCLSMCMGVHTAPSHRLVRNMLDAAFHSRHVSIILEALATLCYHPAPVNGTPRVHVQTLIECGNNVMKHLDECDAGHLPRIFCSFARLGVRCWWSQPRALFFNHTIHSPHHSWCSRWKMSSASSPT